MYYPLIAGLIALLSLAAPAHARTQKLPEPTTTDIIAAYQQYHDVLLPKLVVPTILEVTLPGFPHERNDVAVLNTTTNTFEPSSLRALQTSAPARPRVTSAPAVGNTSLLTDSNTQTFTEFNLESDTVGRAELSFTYDNAITASSITALLDAYVALPTTIEIHAVVSGREKVVVAASRVSGNTIMFPKTTASSWRIIYTYGQPLRISELRINEDRAISPITYTLRFLAQPGEAYRIYVNPDRFAPPTTGEAARLDSASEITRTSLGNAAQNSSYAIADTDGDSVPDIRDNCVSTPNSDQLDVNQNSRGDVCDDFDHDGVVNASDNCREKPNVAQTDTDGDSLGDACDGEESRMTERYPWLPWVGLGLAALILIALFALALNKPPVFPPTTPADPQV